MNFTDHNLISILGTENNKNMSQLIKIYEENPNEREIDRAIKVLKRGGLVIYPTDTVYGIGCDITNARAIGKMAQYKGVKLDKANFSFIFSDLSNLSEYVRQIDTPTFTSSSWVRKRRR